MYSSLGCMLLLLNQRNKYFQLIIDALSASKKRCQHFHSALKHLLCVGEETYHRSYWYTDTIGTKKNYRYADTNIDFNGKLNSLPRKI